MVPATSLYSLTGCEKEGGLMMVMYRGRVFVLKVSARIRIRSYENDNRVFDE